MTRRVLAGLWSLTSPHRHFLMNFLLPLGLVLLTCSATAGWLHERDRRQQDLTTYDRDVRIAASRAEKLGLALQLATEQQQRDGVTVTVTRDRWRTLRDTIWQELADANRVHSDTPKLLEDLPVFLKATDSTVVACTEYQRSCEARAHIADSLLAAKDRQIALLEHAPQWKPPRWSAEAEVLYDPLTVTPAAGGALAVRIAGGVSAVLRTEQRFAPGERPRAYLGLRITR